MSKTETAHTVHGEVKYNVVECDSCGQEIAEKDAYPFAIGREKKDYGYSTKIQACRKGYACELCAGEPIGFPRAESFADRVTNAYGFFTNKYDRLKFMWVVYAVISGLCTALVIIALIAEAV